MKKLSIATLALAFATIGSNAFADPGAYLEITLQISDANRGAAVEIYTDFKQPFLTTIEGAEQKVLLVRDTDVQVLHGFDTVAHAEAYLGSVLFNDDVVAGLAPLLEANPEIRIYQAY